MALSHFHWPYLPQVYWKIWFRHHAPSPVKETQRDKYFHLQLHCLWDTSSFSSCSWRLLNQGHSVLWAPWSQKDHFRSWKFLESTYIKAHFGADEYLIIFGQTFYRIFLVSYHLRSDSEDCASQRDGLNWCQRSCEGSEARPNANIWVLRIPLILSQSWAKQNLADTFLNLYIEQKSKAHIYTR